ncbi:hypothetical protein [Mycolicibacterium bacteremicum]|uniref:hypothetical protein n=1 Tax=Mycolicibacterium bacteremicum TaxID=564198 RepID=UPI0026EF9349|nr:hypothetical protein [Mycolicibacterium bacteremicum]
MEMFVPETTRQAVWFMVGSFFAAAMGTLRLMSFANHGGVLVLAMGVAFLGLAAVGIAGSAIRLRNNR